MSLMTSVDEIQKSDKPIRTLVQKQESFESIPYLSSSRDSSNDRKNTDEIFEKNKENMDSDTSSADDIEG